MIDKIKQIIKKPSMIYLYLSYLGYFKNVPDDVHLKRLFKIMIGKPLNLNSPQTFNEKMQWLKINNRKKEYTNMVDKYEMKKIISNLIGDSYVIPTIGVYDRFDDIDFSILPKQFVIKCTHDSGGLVIVRDKSKLDINKTRNKINKCLKKNYYYFSREWPYKYVKPRIIIEKYMSNGDNDLIDYKVHNFNGVPKIILVCKQRFKNAGLTEDFFDINWNHLDLKRPNHNNNSNMIPKPSKIDEMIKISKIISQNIPFVRTDFYIIGERIFLGEITFFPAAGFGKFVPEEWDKKIGNMLELPKIKEKNEK